MIRKQISVLLLLLFCAFALSAQVTYEVQNFSEDYYATVQIADTSKVVTRGVIAVFKTNSDKELIELSADELAVDFEKGKIKANVQMLPYGEQSVLMYQDFNFDGKKDFAIEDGHYSCYGGPSFQIFLYTPKGFYQSPQFTRLAQEYCGMFQVDYKEKKIYTMTKSGCCWHQYSTFVVENNRPKIIKIKEVTHVYPFLKAVSIQTWNGNGFDTIYRTYLQEGLDEIFSFRLQKNNKLVKLFVENQILYYALLEKGGEMEFLYPKVQNVEKEGEFQYVFGGNIKQLSFTNKNATYSISEQDNAGAKQVKIDVNIDGKVYILVANPNSIKGKLHDLNNIKCTNLKKLHFDPISEEEAGIQKQ